MIDSKDTAREAGEDVAVGRIALVVFLATAVLVVVLATGWGS